MTDNVTLSFQPEIECVLVGTRRRAEPDVGLLADYYDDTGFESATINGADLCAGLDPASKAIVLANLFEAYGDDYAQESASKRR